VFEEGKKQTPFGQGKKPQDSYERGAVKLFFLGEGKLLAKLGTREGEKKVHGASWKKLTRERRELLSKLLRREKGDCSAPMPEKKRRKKKK